MKPANSAAAYTDFFYSARTLCCVAQGEKETWRNKIHSANTFIVIFFMCTYRALFL
jgi:hypothetical protein